MIPIAPQSATDAEGTLLLHRPLHVLNPHPESIGRNIQHIHRLLNNPSRESQDAAEKPGLSASCGCIDLYNVIDLLDLQIYDGQNLLVVLEENVPAHSGLIVVVLKFKFGSEERRQCVEVLRDAHRGEDLEGARRQRGVGCVGHFGGETLQSLKGNGIGNEWTELLRPRAEKVQRVLCSDTPGLRALDAEETDLGTGFIHI